MFFVHGWEGHPQEGWRPWLKNELEKQGYTVINPQMPDTKNPTMRVWVSCLASIVGNGDDQCYFIGHSLGCITILRYLETLPDKAKVGGAILVAGFGEDLEYKGYKGELASFFQTPVDWEKAKGHCNKFVAIHSADDPWINIKNNKLFVEKLGAESVIMNNMKHFSGDDGITKVEPILDYLLKISPR